MTKEELQRMYNKGKSELVSAVELMKITGKSLGKTIDDIQDDVMQTADLY